MKTNLSKVIFASAAVAAMALATLPTMAETTTLKVPFNFTVDGKECAAGVYSVQKDSRGDILRLVGRDATQGFSWAANWQGGAGDGRVVLKFDESGQKHVLQSVQYGHIVTPHLDKKTSKSNDMTSREISGE